MRHGTPRGQYDIPICPPLRRALREIYKGICQYCMAAGADHTDHIIPRARGGADNLANYILACASCNLRKGKGEIAPQYLALITAIADKNKDWVLGHLRKAGQANTAVTGKSKSWCIRVGLSPALYKTVHLSNPPSRLELAHLVACNDYFIDIRKKLDAARQEVRAG